MKELYLKLEEAVTPVPRHVDENVGAGVGEQPLRAGRRLRQPAGQQPHEILHGDLIAPVVDLDIVSVHVDVLSGNSMGKDVV